MTEIMYLIRIRILLGTKI